MTLTKDFFSHRTVLHYFLAQCPQWFGELICFCLLYLFCTFLIIPVFDHSLIWFPQGHCENLTFANCSGWLCSKIVSHLQIFSRLQTNFLFFKCGYWGLFVCFSLLVWKSIIVHIWFYCRNEHFCANSAEKKIAHIFFFLSAPSDV